MWIPFLKNIIASKHNSLTCQQLHANSSDNCGAVSDIAVTKLIQINYST